MLTFTRYSLLVSLWVTLGVANAAPAEGALRIGLNTSVTGTGSEAGQYEANGAKLAVDEINQGGGVLGRKLEVVIEDNQTTNPGGVSAFTRLASAGDIVAILGPSRSTQVNAVEPNIGKAGLPVMIGGSDPTLTQRGNRWLFRFRPTDRYSARVLAEYGAKFLGLKKWAVVHSTDTFGTSGVNNLIENLKAYGVTPVLKLGYANKQPDFTPVVLAIKQSGADVLGTYFTFSEDIGIFARQLRQLGLDIPWIGSASIVTDTAMKLAGSALHGTYGITDYAEDSNPQAKAFARKYQTTYNLPADLYAAWTYDATHVLINAIIAARSTEPEAIRGAILAVKGYRGVEGIYNFAPNGDGLHGYNIVKNDHGKIVFMRHIEFND